MTCIRRRFGQTLENGTGEEVLGLESSQQQDSKQGLVGTWTVLDTLGFLYIITDGDERIYDFCRGLCSFFCVPRPTFTEGKNARVGGRSESAAIFDLHLSKEVNCF